MRGRDLALLLVFSVLGLGANCWVFNPPVAEIKDQLRYGPTLRGNMQVVARWWPLLPVPRDRPPAAFGALPFPLPATFQESITGDVRDYPFPVSPTGVTCEGAWCGVRWHGAVEAGRYALSASIDTEARRLVTATSAITSPIYGTWRTGIADGDLLSVRLEAALASPVTGWRLDCEENSTCHFSGSYARGMEVTGTWGPGATRSTLQPTPWVDAFPWLGRPSEFRLTEEGPIRRVEVDYGNGMRLSRRIDLERGQWEREGPEEIVAIGARTDAEWLIDADYPRGQVLASWELRVTDSTAPDVRRVHLTEHRATRRGERQTIHITAWRDRSLMALRWQEEGSPWQGRLQVRRSNLGWRVEGYWETADGHLINVTGRHDRTGVWSGSFAGWHPQDGDQPRETGDWVMLPDGTFRSTLLFRQVNEAYVEVETFSPPEGVSPLLLED